MKCSGCGIDVDGGLAGCQVLFEQLQAREIEAPALYKFHRMMVDAYAMQHPDQYGKSAKSFVAHLAGLCAAVEHASAPAALQGIRRLLDGNPKLERPAPPAFRGEVTILDVLPAPDVVARTEAIERWVRSVWEAYLPLHETARRWIAASFETRGGRIPSR